jgi:membrane-bound serine protease (ClpP class)
VSWSVLVPTVAIVSLFFIGVVSIAVRAQMRKVMTGGEGMIGAMGQTVSAVHEGGKVLVRGEYWNAFSRLPIEKGKKVAVVGVKELKLEIEERS